MHTYIQYTFQVPKISLIIIKTRDLLDLYKVFLTFDRLLIRDLKEMRKYNQN